MKRYDNYKSSGVEWIGDIPEAWNIKKGKYLFGFMNGYPFDSKKFSFNPNAKFQIIRIRDINNHSSQTFWDGDCIQEALIDNDDILIGMDGDFNISKWKGGKALLNQRVCKVFGKDSISNEYLIYLLPFSLKVINDLTYYTTVKHLSNDDLWCDAFPVPPLSEQTAIAKYLDEKTEQIDKLIAGKRRLIELLKEERLGVINQAVTRGINQNAKLKPSGIAWLGDIPEHWVVVSIGYRFEVQLGKMLDEKRITGKHLAPYLRNTDVQWQKINTIDLPVMDFSEDDREKFSLKNGDLLVCEGGEVGRCAIWKEEISDCFYQKALHRIRPVNKEKDSTEFLFYLMFVASERGLFTATGNSNIIQHLPAEKLRKHQFPFPPIEEQKQIVEFIETATEKIDATIAKIEKEIGFMREYRTALISEVVTGKIKVV